METKTTTNPVGDTEPVPKRILGDYDSLVSGVADWMEESHSPVKLGLTILVDAILESRDRKATDTDKGGNPGNPIPSRYQAMADVKVVLGDFLVPFEVYMRR